jgi:hypothetical protein
MEKKSINDTEILRRIHLTRVLAGNVKIPFKSGRPKERGIIKQEDIIDLKILLNTAKSFNNFLYQC